MSRTIHLVEALGFGPGNAELHCIDCVHPDEWRQFREHADGIAIGSTIALPIWRCAGCGRELAVLEVWPDQEEERP